jgi:hypothetical protein
MKKILDIVREGGYDVIKTDDGKTRGIGKSGGK